MKRTASRILWYVPLGAATTIVVALGCAWWVPFNSDRLLPARAAGELLDAYCGEGIRPFEGSIYDGIGVRQRSALGGVYGDDQSVELRGVTIVESGLPLRALRGWSADGDYWLIRRPAPPPRPARRQDFAAFLPLLPIWPAFLLDSFIFALIWIGIIGAFRAARGDGRMRRGCCPACGYDLRDPFEAGCPECGWGRAEL